MIKRLAAAVVLTTAAATFLPTAGANALVTRGRTGCIVVGECQGGTYGGPTVHHPRLCQMGKSHVWKPCKAPQTPRRISAR